MIHEIMKKILLDENYAEVSYLPEYKLVQVIWKDKKFNTEEYQQTFNVGLDYVAQNNKPFVLFISDTTKQAIVSPEDRKWFQKSAISRAVDAGLKRAAVVVSKNPFKRYYMNLILKVINKFKIPLKLFSDYDSALKWCLSFDEYK